MKPYRRGAIVYLVRTNPEDSDMPTATGHIINREFYWCDGDKKCRYLIEWKHDKGNNLLLDQKAWIGQPKIGKYNSGYRRFVLSLNDKFDPHDLSIGYELFYMVRNNPIKAVVTAKYPKVYATDNGCQYDVRLEDGTELFRIKSTQISKFNNGRNKFCLSSNKIYD